ncbi:MAG TPA: hypothetical protein VF432_27945 [Thermoanaerobaculia bacterium]
MIRLVRTVHTNDVQAAMNVASQVVDHFKGKHSQKSIQVFADRFAAGGRRLHWHIDFEDLAHFEKWQADIAGDEKYRSIIEQAQGSGTFVPNSMSDVIGLEIGAAAQLALH